MSRDHTLHYLAYGSNLHPHRLIQRVPNARFLMTARLDGHRVSFSKLGHDGSSKCSLAKSEGGDGAAHVAIYEMPAAEKHLLDLAEGLGDGYDQAQYPIKIANAHHDVFAYTAAATHLVRELPPYDWYKTMVVEGARYHGFPGDYIRELALQPSMPDPDRRRRVEAEGLLMQMRKRTERPTGIALSGL